MSEPNDTDQADAVIAALQQHAAKLDQLVETIGGAFQRAEERLGARQGPTFPGTHSAAATQKPPVGGDPPFLLRREHHHRLPEQLEIRGASTSAFRLQVIIVICGTILVGLGIYTGNVDQIEKLIAIVAPITGASVGSLGYSWYRGKVAQSQAQIRVAELERPPSSEKP